MFFNKIIYYLFFLCVGCFMVQSKPFIEAQTKTLPNGLRVVIIPNGVAPVVSIGVAYCVGTADDPLDKVGISHFLEHMMFKGTKNVPGDQFKKEILIRGGQTNALTEYDYTFYYTTISKDHLDFILKLEADRMQNLSFQEKEVISERQVVLEERLMRLENHPLGLLFELQLRALYPHHPYGCPPIGYPHHIQNYDFESVKKHYQTWYAPNNAILFVCGNVSMDEVMPIIEKYFKEIPSHSHIPERKRPSNPELKGIAQSIIQKNDRQSFITLNWCFEAPNFFEGKKEHFYALQILEQVLGGSEVSEFYYQLVECKNLALQVSSQYDCVSLNKKDFTIMALLQKEEDVQKLKDEVNSYLKNIIEKGISQEELNRAKIALEGQLIFIKDNNDGLMSMIAAYLAKGFSLDFINSYVEKINAVTVDDVKNAARDIFGVPPILTVEVYPTKNQSTPSQGS